VVVGLAPAIEILPTLLGPAGDAVV